MSSTNSEQTTTTATPISKLLPLPTSPPLSLARRICAATGWSIFGLLFFYLLMVAQSSMSKQIILERLPSNSWTRTASRQTGANVLVPFFFFLLSDKRSMSSLKWAILLACAIFAHFVIIASDARVFSDEEIFNHMRFKEKLHPLFAPFPAVFWRGIGMVGIFSGWLLAMERTYGPALRDRRAQLPLVSKLAAGWLVALFAFYYVDRFVAVLLMEQANLNDVLYPLPFLLALFVACTYRHFERMVSKIAQHKITTTTGKKDL